MFYVYIGCLTFGVAYALLSLVFGGHGVDHGGVDHTAITSHGGGDHADVPSPFNPLVIASAITTFGSVGLVGKIGMGMSNISSAVFALIFAGVVGAIIFFGVIRLMYGSQSDSTFSQTDLAGVDAEVLTPIPVDGIGEIAFTIHGERSTQSAKSARNEAIERGERVKIKEISGNVAVVSRKLSIDELEFPDTEEKGSNDS